MPVLCVPVQGMSASKQKTRILLKSWLLSGSVSLSDITFLPPPTQQHRGIDNGQLRSPNTSFLLLPFQAAPLLWCGPPWAALLKDKPAPLWAFSSQGIFPCSSMGQQRGYLFHVVFTNIAGESLHHRCLLSGPALLKRVLHWPYGRSPCTCAGFGMAEL